MFNVEMERKGQLLTIKIDLSLNRGPSGSGKTLIIATTAGNADVPGPGDMMIGLNVYKRKT